MGRDGLGPDSTSVRRDRRLPERPVGHGGQGTLESARTSTRRSGSSRGRACIRTCSGPSSSRGRSSGTSGRCSSRYENSLVTDLENRWESYRVFTAPVNWRFETGDRAECRRPRRRAPPRWRRATPAHRRSCRRSGPSRCGSRSGWERTPAGAPARAAKMFPAGSMRGDRPAPRMRSITYRRAPMSASEYAVRLTPSANVPPAGRPNTLSASSSLRRRFASMRSGAGASIPPNRAAIGVTAAAAPMEASDPRNCRRLVDIVRIIPRPPSPTQNRSPRFTPLDSNHRGH